MLRAVEVARMIEQTDNATKLPTEVRAEILEYEKDLNKEGYTLKVWDTPKDFGPTVEIEITIFEGSPSSSTYVYGFDLPLRWLGRECTISEIKDILRREMEAFHKHKHRRPRASTIGRAIKWFANALKLGQSKR